MLNFTSVMFYLQQRPCEIILKVSNFEIGPSRIIIDQFNESAMGNFLSVIGERCHPKCKIKLHNLSENSS